MPSKGVQVYSYIAYAGVRIEFYVPKGGVTHDHQQTWASDHLEVESKNLGLFEVEGRFGFRVFKNNVEMTHQWVEINTFTGNLGDGTMNQIAQMRSIFSDNLVITYGFYDAGHGVAGLTDRDQCYVTVTRDQSRWMSELVPTGQAVANKPATYFALPCPHDCGMDTMQSVDLLLNTANQSAFTKRLAEITGSWLANIAINVADSTYARLVVFALSITQKDTISDMLRIGARYFEFRPAKIPQDLASPGGLDPDQYYFVHAVIPGLSLNMFLGQVLQFLETNTGEIVVVQMRRDGIQNSFTTFDNASIDQVVNAAITRSSSTIRAATEDEFKTLSINQLRTANKRLVIAKEHDNSQYSSWNETAYATLTPGPIVNAFNGMSRNAQGNATFTELQCQATATSVDSVLAYSVAASNAATSVLMATKASCDMATLPWIRDNAASRFDPSKSLVVMNDWIDGATCDVAIHLSQQRLNS